MNLVFAFGALVVILALQELREWRASQRAKLLLAEIRHSRRKVSLQLERMADLDLAIKKHGLAIAGVQTEMEHVKAVGNEAREFAGQVKATLDDLLKETKISNFAKRGNFDFVEGL
jgi:hypothetical protein